MGFIILTGKSHGAGFSILRPVPDRISPCMDVLIDCQGRHIAGDAACAVAHNTTVLSAAHVHCGFPCGIGVTGRTVNVCPATSFVGALLPLIRQRLGAAGHNGKGGSFIFFYFHILWLGGNSGGDFERAFAGRCAFQLAGALYSDCAIVGQSCSLRHGEAGVLSDGQGFVRTDLQVLLQGHIAVDGAAIAVKDDTSAFTICSNLKAIGRSIYNPPVLPSVPTMALPLTVRLEGPLV